MAVHRLQPHPAAPPHAVTAVRCAVARQGPAAWRLDFEVAGPAGALVLPETREPRRTDGLWKTTCFELFVRRPGEAGYFEFNLSPSCEWAAYAFDGYRQRMIDLDVAAPVIEAASGALMASITTPAPGPWLASISAVIEEANGTKSYWALAHPSDKPDFHHPDSFVLELP
jgi:hypothetical protein